MQQIKSMIAATALVFCGSAQSAAISYSLDQSNVLADGVSYLTVTISDSMVNPGDIDFRVETSSVFTPGTNFGIQSFGFNPSVAIGSANIYNLSGGWKLGSGNVGGFGSFAATESGTGQSRQSPLTFSIHADMDSIYSYANPSSGTSGNWVGAGSPYFVAHVAGFTSDLRDASGNMVTSAYFAGNTPMLVPIPAAAWLLGSGLIGLVGMARRKTA